MHFSSFNDFWALPQASAAPKSHDILPPLTGSTLPTSRPLGHPLIPFFQWAALAVGLPFIPWDTGFSLDWRYWVHCRHFLTSKYCRREGIWGTFRYSPPVMSQACKTRKGLSAKPALTEFFQPDVVLSSNSSGPQEEGMNIEVKGTLSQSERGPTSGYLSRCANVLFLPLAHILRPFGDYSVGRYGSSRLSVWYRQMCILATLIHFHHIFKWQPWDRTHMP